jgi:hypothetical protein
MRCECHKPKATGSIVHLEPGIRIDLRQLRAARDVAESKLHIRLLQGESRGLGIGVAIRAKGRILCGLQYWGAVRALLKVSAQLRFVLGADAT